eukprot:TRINITY_DN36878_c0_g2_i1.p1 TRINITY_DN36878_c0_g2~~TRINITY_DN36878_c0_g2_i1.p1  ORF type:complete len:356 (-),score=60.13 TRINITY_DN36878_c0_g2_i1:116-1183(-)
MNQPFQCFCAQGFPGIQPFLAHLCQAHRLLYPFPRDVDQFRQFLQRCNGPALLSPEHNQDKISFRDAALEEALAVVTAERQTLRAGFQRQCLFCQDEVEGLEPYFAHLWDTHGLNCGNLDNLVSVESFLDAVEHRQAYLQCLNCDKQFGDPATLRTHMRKKKHFRIHPRNSSFDRFWLVNYLRPDQPWATQPWAQAVEDGTEGESNSDEEENAEGWSGWKEQETELARCLLCSESVAAERVVGHMKDAHSFDLLSCFDTLDCDVYKCIKTVNYIRCKTTKNVCWRCEFVGDDREALLEHLSVAEHRFVSKSDRFLEDDTYLATDEEDQVALSWLIGSVLNCAPADGTIADAEDSP